MDYPLKPGIQTSKIIMNVKDRAQGRGETYLSVTV
jgi:hypothetical protein